MASHRDAGASAAGIVARRDCSNDDPARKKDEACRRIATAQVEGDFVDAALLGADTVGDAGVRSSLLGEVARIQARAGLGLPVPQPRGPCPGPCQGGRGVAARQAGP